MILSNWYIIEKKKAHVLYSGGVAKLKKDLTIRPKASGDELPEPMEMYRETEKNLYLPFRFGLDNFGEPDSIKMRKPRKVVYKKKPDPNHPLAPKGQREFFNDALTEARSKYPQYALTAKTGAGKTICILHTIAEMQIDALILVPTDALIRQWVKQATKWLGLKESEIGIVKQARCEYQGRKITIASMASIRSRKYSNEFYKYHGAIFYDEAHKVSQQQMAVVYGKFYAKIQQPTSATFRRKDGRDAVTYFWFGKPRVIARGSKPLPIVVHKKVVTHRYRMQGNNRNWLISHLAKLEFRNQYILRMLLNLRQKKKYTLVISDSVYQLQHLRDNLVSKGVDSKKIGLFVGEYFTGNQTLTFTRKEGFNPALLKPFAYEIETRFKTEVKSTASYFKMSGGKLQDDFNRICEFVSKKTGFSYLTLSTEFPVKEERKKTDVAYIEKILASKDLEFLLATYGVMEMGIDVPWLQVGIDATPRSDPEQTIGRVARVYDGKKVGYWITLVDTGYNGVVDNINKSRMKFYKKISGVKLVN